MTAVMKKSVSLGVDIGGTNTALGVVDAEGNVLVKTNISTPKRGDTQQYVI